MARELTPAAKAAKMIRQNLRRQGLDVAVRSQNYSMGCSVDVTMTDQRPEIRELVEQYCSRFQYGYFDGMTDCYESNNRRDDIPQAKFVAVHNDMSDAMREAVYQHLRTHWHGGDELPETYAEGANVRWLEGWVSDFVHRLFTGAVDTFWKTRPLASADNDNKQAA